MSARVPLKSKKVTLSVLALDLAFLDPLAASTFPVVVVLNMQLLIVAGRVDAFDKLSKQLVLPFIGLSKVPPSIVGWVALFICNPSASGYSKVKLVPEKVPVMFTSILLSASPKIFASLSALEVPVKVNVPATDKEGLVEAASSKDIIAAFEPAAVAVSDPPIVAAKRVN